MNHTHGCVKCGMIEECQQDVCDGMQGLYCDGCTSLMIAQAELSALLYDWQTVIDSLQDCIVRCEKAIDELDKFIKEDTEEEMLAQAIEEYYHGMFADVDSGGVVGEHVNVQV